MLGANMYRVQRVDVMHQKLLKIPVKENKEDVEVEE